MKPNRVKYSTLITFADLEKVIPAGYRRAYKGEDREPGLYGEGFGGEPLIVLLPDDDGAWFDALVAPLEEADALLSEQNSNYNRDINAAIRRYK